MSRALTSLLLLFAIAIPGCKKLDPGERVSIAEVCGAKYDPAPGGDLKRVSIEGHLDIPRGLFTMCSDTCGMVLKANPTDADGVRVNLKVGGGKNEMEKLPEKYTEQDLAVTTNEGKTVGVGAKVRVTGGRLGSAADKACQIYGVDLIEGL